MANKAISELPQALNVNNQDLFVLEQSGIAKKLPAETFITEQGIIDALAEALDGHGGIQSVTLSSVSGRIRTYRITFTDQSATTFQVYDGTSIDRISRTSSSGLDDVYTIFLSDGTTTFFTVHNGADGTVSEAMLNDALKNKAPVITETTESSAIANFTDGADDMPIQSLVADIEPVQDLHGQSNPYPAGGGKQKIAYPYAFTNEEKNGCTATVQSDGAITFSGNPSANSTWNVKRRTDTSGNGSLFLQEGEYVLNGCPSGGGGSTYRFILINQDGSTNGTDNGSGLAFTVPSGGAYYGIQLFIASGYNTNGLVFKPMIRLSSVSDATFAPYSNICPITGWTGCNVKRTGKNLFNYTLFNDGTIFSANNDGSITVKMQDTRGWASIPQFYLEAGTYTFSRSNTSGVVQCWNATNSTWVVYFAEGEAAKSFTLSASAVIQFRIGTQASSYPFNVNIQLELGSTATDYESYQDSSVSVDWTTEAGTVYGGTIDVATGLLTVEWGIVNLGDMNWGGSNGTFNVNFSNVSPSWTRGGTTWAKCSCYKVESWDSIDRGTYSDYSIHGLPYNGITVLRVYDSRYSTVSDFKSSVNGEQLCYELGQPQTYQLTGQQLMTLLGTNNVWTDIGNVSVTYPADTKLYIEKLTMPTEDDLVANQAITSGKYFMVGNSLYLALANIASGAQITIGTNAQRVSLADALNTINS